MHEHPHGTRICAAEHLQFQMPRSELIIIALGLSLRIYIYTALESTAAAQ
jgi:hypothetical protein